MPPLTLILATLTLITLPTPPPHHSGNQTDEQAYLFKKVLDACVPVPGKLARFSYRIADVNVCTQAWCIAIGLYASNSRVVWYPENANAAQTTGPTTRRRLSASTFSCMHNFHP